MRIFEHIKSDLRTKLEDLQVILSRWVIKCVSVLFLFKISRDLLVLKFFKTPRKLIFF